MPFASFLTSLFGSPEKKQKLKTVKTVSATLPEYLNWNHFEKRNGIVYLATKNSMLLVFMKLNPHTDYYSPTGDEDVAETWNRLLMTLPDKTSFWYEFSKGLLDEESGYIGSSDLFINPGDRELEKLREEEFRNHAKSYQQKRILCMAFVPSVDKAGLSEFSFESFEKTLLDIKGRFQAVKIDTELMEETAICTYLHDCISTKHYQIAEPSAASNALSDALWDDDIDSTLVPLKLGERYISVITIDDFPVTGTFAEMLSGITGIPGDIRWVTRYTTASAESGRKFIDDMRRKYFSRRFSTRDVVSNTMFNSSIDLMDTGEISKYQECELAMADNGNATNFGHYTALFVLQADTETELQRMEDSVQNVLAKFGLIYRREELNLFAAWLSSLPGNLEANPRKLFLSTGNVASLLSLTAPYEGERENKLMKEVCGCGLPHATGLLPNSALYHLNLNGRSNSGHTFILGPTGSGKSILLGFLASQWGKYPGARVIIFDKGASSMKLVKANDGAVYYPGYEDDTTCFQPLKDAANHIDRCLSFLEAVASVQGVELKANDRQEIADALKLMIPGHESLSVFRDILRGKNHDSELVSALENYTMGGAYGTLFDAEEDTLSPSSWPSMTMIEMGELMNRGDAAIIPALTYIIGQMDELFRDLRPTLLILDEAWVYMRHPVFKGFIEQWLKTLRKYNVFVILATQEVSDYDEVIGSVLTNCHTRILLPNQHAMTGPLAPLYKGIGLTETEIQVISNGTTMQSQRHYFVMQEEGNAIVDFALTPEQLRYLR